MTALAEHIAALIIHNAKQRHGGDLSFFVSDLHDLFEGFYHLDVPNVLLEEACEILVRTGGCEKLHSPLTTDLYQLNASRALRYYSPESIPDENTSHYYDQAWERAQEYRVLKTYNFGGQPWVDRVIRTLSERNLFADESALELDSVFVPASDRVVRVDHNNPLVNELDEGLGQIEELVRADNSDRIGDPADKRRFREQLEGARRLLRLEKLSTRALGGLVLTVLTYLATRFADEAIGELAARLLQLVAELFGISL